MGMKTVSLKKYKAMEKAMEVWRDSCNKNYLDYVAQCNATAHLQAQKAQLQLEIDRLKGRLTQKEAEVSDLHSRNGQLLVQLDAERKVSQQRRKLLMCIAEMTNVGA